MNDGVAAMQKRTAAISNFFHLSEENALLLEENEQLLEERISSFKKMEGNFVVIEDSVWQRQYRMLNAKVINGTLYQNRNYFTIDKGSIDGVAKKQGVISLNGIVGRIAEVSEHYAIVESIISESFSTGAYVKRTGNLGYLKWNKDPAETTLSQVVITAPIAVGDMVYSKVGSGYFPPDTPVGEIIDLNENEGEAYYDIRVKLSTDFSNLRHVYVVTNDFQNELDDLQEEFYP
ncbi:MAG: rod shape-determining protein MreC [Bacteroidota bacterium]